eukprot:scaffold395_cov243-Pinguiococcus_pyrenoidosus.AAC.15
MSIFAHACANLRCSVNLQISQGCPNSSDASHLHADLVSNQPVVHEAYSPALCLQDVHGAGEHLEHGLELVLHARVHGPFAHVVVLRASHDVLEVPFA